MDANANYFERAAPLAAHSRAQRPGSWAEPDIAQTTCQPLALQPPSREAEHHAQRNSQSGSAPPAGACSAAARTSTNLVAIRRAHPPIGVAQPLATSQRTHPDDRECDALPDRRLTWQLP
jgi:hypothetical protein